MIHENYIPTPEQAIRAIIARIDGVFDDPDLLAFGPLHIDKMVDVKEISNAALICVEGREWKFGNIITELKATADCGYDLMKRTVYLDAQLLARSEMNNDTEVGQVTRMRQQLSRNNVLIEELEKLNG